MIATLLEYRSLTHDYDSYDGYVLSALTESQQEIERLTERYFEEDTYTEILPVHADRIYPHATPIASVSAPSDITVDGAAVAILTGTGYWPIRAQAVTYIGGYSPEDMPVELKRIVSDLAFRMVPPPEAASVPIGVTSMTVGDVKMQGSNLGRPQAVMTGSLRLRIARWRRAEAGASNVNSY